MTQLVASDSEGRWTSNPHCWQENLTYDACCGDTQHGPTCFDNYYPRESCCNVTRIECWNDIHLTWDGCCRKALPYGREHCFGDDRAKGYFCCIGFMKGYRTTHNAEFNSFVKEMIKRDRDGEAEDLRTVTKHGYQFNIASTGHDFAWTKYENWEPSTFRVFDHFVSPKMGDGRRAKMVWDIGGHIGGTCLYLAQLADHVLVMEPALHAFAALEKNIRANPKFSGRITSVNKALGRTNKVVSLSNKGWAMDRIIPQARGDEDGFQAKTDMVTPEALLREYPALNATEFIKIDVEGYEVEIVPALEPFLRRRKPRLFLSLHPGVLTLEQMEDICMRLHHIFPHLYELTTSSTLVPLDLEKLRRLKFKSNAYGATDILGVWSEIPVEKKEMIKTGM